MLLDLFLCFVLGKKSELKRKCAFSIVYSSFLIEGKIAVKTGQLNIKDDVNAVNLCEEWFGKFQKVSF